MKKTVDCINAIEHLINDYTRQKQINEEHQRENGELREKVKELERNSNCDSVYAIKFATMQQQINEKDKRIQELENKLQDINTYILINGIDESLRTATQIRVENQHEYMIQQKINKLEEERNHWHGCFIVAMENSIAKEKVKDKIEELRNQINIDICIENNIEKHYELKYKIEVLQELLETK